MTGYLTILYLYSSPVVVYGFLTTPTVLEEVGIIEVHFGIVRDSP